MSDAQFIEKSSYDLPIKFKNKRIAKKACLIMKAAINQYSLPKASTKHFFNTMTDSMMSNMDLKLISLNQYFENFGFLYDLNKLKTIPKENILKKLSRFRHIPASRWEQWLSTIQIIWKITNMIPNLPDFIKDVEQLLQYIIENYPNIYYYSNFVNTTSKYNLR